MLRFVVIHRFHENLVHLDMSKPFELTVHAVAVGCQINNLFIFDGYFGMLLQYICTNWTN